MSLNPKQTQAVTCDDHCLVVACPGSGKSRVVVAKVKSIVETQPDARIIVTTFSREGANELKHRLALEIGEEKLKRSVFASTFHSLALQHLKQHHIKVRIAREAEQTEFMKRALAITGLEMSFEDAARVLQHCKTLPHYEPLNDPAGKLYLAYQDLCKKNNVVDFYEVMLISLRLIKEGSLPILNATHMLVDEFQDSDEIQYQYMMEHARTGRVKVTAVADDDQAIYAFRNSLGFNGMSRFEKDADAIRITLDTNYRCHREILSAADRLISKNVERMDKRLHAHKGRGGSVEVQRFPERTDEAEALAFKILHSYGYTDILDIEQVPQDLILPIQKGDWCVLARTNFQLEAVDGLFASLGIPFYKSGKSFWDRPPTSYLLSLLQSLLTTKKAGIENLLYWAGLSNETLDNLNDRLDGDFANLFKADKVEAAEFGDFPAEVRDVLSSFAKGLPGWAKSARKKDDNDINNAIFGVCDWMLAHCIKRADRTRIEMASRFLQALHGSLSTRINVVTKNKTKKDSDGVALMTMHASKGLEFNNVWIVGTEENIIPSSGNVILSEKVIAEERRLMYVAMTRAKDALYISSTADNEQSRFIAEAVSRS